MAFGRMTTLGLDIGTTGIRAVELSWRDGLPVVERWGAADFDTTTPEGETPDPAETGARIRRLLQKHGFRARFAAHSVCGRAVVPQYFNFPQLMPEDVADAVRIEVESGLPFRNEGTLITYLLFPEQRPEGGKVRTHGMAIAADGVVVERRLEAIRHAGLETFSVETDATACANAFLATHDTAAQAGTTAILNIGHCHSNLALVGGEGTLLMRDMLWGGSHLTRRIAEQLTVPEDEAARLKECHWSEGPTMARTLDECLPDLLQASAQELVTRLRDTIHYWVSERLVPKVERVFLTGGGSQVRGLPELLSEMLAVPVEHWSLATTAAGGSRARAQWEYRLAVAFGLALRKF